MAVETHGTGTLPQIKGVKDVPYDELFVSGHRTCQGCESALVMRHMVKASGPRTIVLGSTGCMYVANTTYYTTPWVVPWMHTQLGASGSAALGTAAGCAAYAVDLMNKIRKALELGGPTFVHTLDPCPKGWDYHPQYSQELGHLAVETGIWPLYEVIDGVCNLTGPTRQIAEGRKKRKPVYEYLKRQGRFAHFADEDVEHFQAEVDKMWTEWLIPGVIPFTIPAKDQTILKIDKKALHEQKTA